MVNEVSAIKAGSASSGGGYLRIPLADIHEPHHGRVPDQALIDSVKKFGVLQPVLVTRRDDGYELIAGSRRIQAARTAGLADAPALIVPPERAGALDVFLEENLNRVELSEADRTRLRDRWMRETGRSEEQALERIPTQDIWQEVGPPPSKKRAQVWMIAAGVLAVVSAVLLTMIFKAKPVDSRTVIIPVEFVESAVETPPPPDTQWMEPFRFPGSQRTIENDRLSLTFFRPMIENTALTPRGRLALNQLAAIVLSSERPLNVDLVTSGSEGAIIASHLISEGLSPDQLIIRLSAEPTVSATIYPE